MNVTIDKSIFECYGTRDVDKQLFSKVLHTAQYRCHTVSLSQSCEMEDIYKLDSNDAFFLQEFFNNYINSSRETRLSDCLLKVGGEFEDNNKVFSLDEVYDYISSLRLPASYPASHKRERRSHSRSDTPQCFFHRRRSHAPFSSASFRCPASHNLCLRQDP